MRFNAKILPILAFFAFLVKTIAFSPSFPDAIIILGLISYIVADNLRLKDETINEFRAELKNFKDITEKQSLDIRNLQSKTSAVALSQGMRPLNMQTAPKEQQKKSEW